MTSTEFAERLWRHIDATGDGCWEWVGRAHHEFGYGKVTIAQKSYDAHRAMYISQYGEVPEGMFVLHKCDNPRCCRPDHLYLGTPADNMRDRAVRGKARKKLTEDAVREIRRVYVPFARKGDGAAHNVAKKFGVTCRVVRLVATGEAWGWLPKEAS